jgi:hypothetical protein
VHVLEPHSATRGATEWQRHIQPPGPVTCLRHLKLILFSMLMSFLTPQAALASWGTGGVDLTLGLKIFGEDAVNSPQFSAALDITWGGRRWPALVDLYVSGSGSSGVNALGDDLTETRMEKGIGLKKVWKLGSFRPQVATGIAHIRRKEHIDFDLEPGERTIEAEGSRLWIAGGPFWRYGSGLTFGIPVRLSELGHHDQPLGGTHIGFSFAWGWPAVP